MDWEKKSISFLKRLREEIMFWEDMVDWKHSNQDRSSHSLILKESIITKHPA